MAGVICLVDREQGGRSAIEATIPGVLFFSVFIATEVCAAYVALK